MISIKRNDRGEPVNARGVRSRPSSIYTPNHETPFRLSRSKFNDFLLCRRCFYLDRVKGVISPSTPGWSLNETTDLLLKREFDACRNAGQPHRIFKRSGLDDVVPFQHPDFDKWRDSLHYGLELKIEEGNIVLHGGVDDVWLHKPTGRLIIVDYKSQAGRRPVSTWQYLSNVHHQAYKVQLDVYAYLLTKMGFPVWPTGYFYVCNADRNAPSFNGQLLFQETLVPYKWNIDWIDEQLSEMVRVLDSPDIPEANPSCENCAYTRALAQITAVPT